ncbi:hypothetical protein BDW02DRAFT_640353 [Decorospora gaudefroyi]|uniref:Galactosyl transferase GMA12/MNN10 family protein n=1 Tax=Decorospora gaudefroyi TaxID=184978 RepID=A0A6A5K8S5_9PLEO|nr:hypothetical protein BDW02DRAFT_640353 [Decorospora gaudefroyi]
MLIRSLRTIPPSFVLVLLFLSFLGWHLSHGPTHEDLPSPPPAPVEAEPKKPRIAIVTFVTEQRSYLHLSLKNHDHYARRHGHDFIVDYEAHTDRAVVYWKFNMLERLIKSRKYDWIWWLDFDTLVTNTGIRVTDIMEEELRQVERPDEVDYLFTEDCNGLNLGSFIVRGHERSLDMLHDAWAVHDEAKTKEVNMSEQDALVKLMKGDKYTGKFHVVPQHKLNAFPEEIPCYQEGEKVWEHGAFILHFAGAWAHVKSDDPTGGLMKKYESEIMWGDWKDFY